MRTLLLVLLAAVAALMLWAIRNQSYENPLVFTLGLLVTALCGYLLADYFFSLERKTLRADLHSKKRELQAMTEEKDLLQTQFKLTTPQAAVEQLEQRLAIIEDEKLKLDGLSRAQTAEISSLKTQLDILKKSHAKFEENSVTDLETTKTETLDIQQQLFVSREKIKIQAAELDTLRAELTLAKKSIATNRDLPESDVFEEKPLDTSLDTEGSSKPIADEKPVENPTDIPVTNASEFAEPIENQPVATETEIHNNSELSASPTAERHPIYGSPDNLRAVQGIGTGIELQLKETGIMTWQQLSETGVDHLQDILNELSGGRYKSSNPTTWPMQAAMLANAQFDELKNFTDQLK